MAARGNLPAPLTSFVGRRREVAGVKGLVAAGRLVTLTGVGGVGKTRLAVRTAGDLARAFRGGVWFVDLAQLREPAESDVDRPALLVLTALGVRQQGTGPPVLQVSDYLSGRQALLVLDNCEHMLPACAALAGELLHRCPELSVLATSREPLALYGETLYPVPPLSVPAAGRHRPGEVSTCEAVALFVERARTVVPGFVVTPENCDALAELCRRLDGVPLAIELAAFRVMVLTPRQILDRLTDRFELLSRAPRAVHDRQQTLRACIEWSFELCDKAERLLWSRLSVFVGDFELDAVEGVCADDALPAGEVLDTVAALVDKSILSRADARYGRARYRMLETIRDYGRERLREAGERTALHRRHRDWYRRLVAVAETEWVSDRQPYWNARLTAEHPNIRAAVEFCLAEPGEAGAVFDLLAPLPRLYWWSRGVVDEGRGWLEVALARVTEPAVRRSRALLQAAYLAFWQGEPEAVERLAEQSRAGADPHALALIHYLHAQVALLTRNDLAGAVEAIGRGLAVLDAALGPEPAVRLPLLLLRGTATGLAGDLDRSRRSYQEVIDIAGPLGECYSRINAMWGLGLVAWREGRAGEADVRMREGLRLGWATLKDPYHTGMSFELLAWIAAGRGSYRRAAVLLGAAGAVLAELGRPIAQHRMLAADHDACARRSREGLGRSAAAAFAEGEALPIDDAVAYALGEQRRPPPGQARGPLTRRERQVAELLAQGLSNREIAAALVISQRTAESHVEHILTKLGFAGRAQVAAWVATQGAGAG